MNDAPFLSCLRYSQLSLRNELIGTRPTLDTHSSGQD